MLVSVSVKILLCFLHWKLENKSFSWDPWQEFRILTTILEKPLVFKKRCHPPDRWYDRWYYILYTIYTKMLNWNLNVVLQVLDIMTKEVEMELQALNNGDLEEGRKDQGCACPRKLCKSTKCTIINVFVALFSLAVFVLVVAYQLRSNNVMNTYIYQQVRF